MIRTAIFGAGFGNYGHFAALQTLKEFKVVAVCGSRFNAGDYQVYASSDWEKVLHEHGLDLVILAVPPDQQTKILLAAMKKKLAVMVEKPLCLKLEEFESIQSQFKLTQNYSAASFIFPELETWKKARELIHEERFGQLRSLFFDWKIESQAIKTKQKSWKSTTANGGSALFHFLPHLMQAVSFFSGTIQELSCVSLASADLGEDLGRPLCSIQMLLQNKALAVINCSLAAPMGSGQTIEFNGSKATVILENKGSDYVRGYKVRFQSENQVQEWGEQALNSRLRGDLDSRTAPLISIYSKFAQNWTTKTAIQPSLVQALETQRLIFLCDESAKKKQWVSNNAIA